MLLARVVTMCALVMIGFGSAQPLAHGVPQEAPGTDAPVTPGPDPVTESEKEAAEPESAQQPVDLEEMARRLEVLAQEVERLRSGETEQIDLTADDARALGLAPSAAATYRQDGGVSIAGYGEMLYEDFRDPDAGARLDYLRAITYIGYRFNEKFLFNSEIELEHANEISVEFAYIDYLAHENIGIRGGMLLVPMGLVNEFHEPTVFIGAKRPETERRIIPSTWRENGVGVHGSVDRVAYRAYVVNGLEASGFGASGVRGGRQKGSSAQAQDLAFVGRVDVTPTPGIFFGGSLYTGGSGQGQIEVDDREFRVLTTIFDLHGQVQIRGMDFRGLFARAHISDAAELNAARGLTGTAGVAKTMTGGYVQVGYDVLSQVDSGDVALMPYYRFERVDTQDTMPTGFERSLATDSTFHTLGVELKPIPNVVVKADYQWVSNRADTERDQFNLNLGYAF